MRIGHIGSDPVKLEPFSLLMIFQNILGLFAGPPVNLNLVSLHGIHWPTLEPHMNTVRHNLLLPISPWLETGRLGRPLPVGNWGLIGSADQFL